jgi:hypothetical protein
VPTWRKILSNNWVKTKSSHNSRNGDFLVFKNT